jgi:hypothetical protein
MAKKIVKFEIMCVLQQKHAKNCLLTRSAGSMYTHIISNFTIFFAIFSMKIKLSAVVLVEQVVQTISSICL